MEDRLDRVIKAVWALVGLFVLVIVVAWLVGTIKVVWPPLVLAVALVYLLNPFVTWCAQRRIPRALGTLLAYIVFAGFLALGGFLVVPVISDQTSLLADQLPEIVDAVTGWLSDRGVEVESPTLESVRAWLLDPTNQDQIQSVLGGAFGVVASVFEAVALTILAPVLAFYLLVDLPTLQEGSRGLIPDRYRDEVSEVGANLSRAMGGFVRGQLFVAFIVAVVSSVGLRILGMELWLVIGILAGMFNLIPFLGPWISGTLAILVALALGDVRLAFGVAVLFFAVQQFDNHLISPTVLRATVKLHPVVIILALLAGASLAGLLGVLVAVPLTAMLKIVIGHLWRTRVLGHSWDTSAQAIVHAHEPDTESLVSRLRTVGRLRLSKPAVHSHEADQDD